MAEFKYAVKNGDNILGLMWDVGNGREVFVTNGNTLDINHSLLVRDSNGNDIKEVEVLEMLNEILPRG
ncbi:hypothetical protein M3649_03455 [Ureibacillus chungkukjangi]|uniref:hypothetical protein n=1 Tax=Ureibacillus chungkukjangi TaxID=1202712 RepID=UPI00203C5C39|nr:hypothetical protein [Ureibacillus chungkukjangi]MCM3387186.1 hypothetical protein [Ureibacillus chungkukjangi]